MPNNITPEQKRAAAQRRNARERAEYSGAPAPVDADLPAEQHAPVRRAETGDRRPAQRQQAAQAGTYGGRPAPEPFKPYGIDPIVVDYEGGEWLVEPWVLDDWDDVEGEQPTDQRQEVLDTLWKLFGQDADRYNAFKQHLRDVYGYVSGNLMLGFIAEVRKVAESGN